MRLNYRGTYFKITGTGNPYITSPTVAIVPTDPTLTSDPTVFPPNATNVAFQFFRQPIKTPDSPAVLPDGACIDLTYSGVDQYGSGVTGASFSPGSATDFSPVVVTFGANGSLDRVFAFNGELTLPLTGVYFLVGKIEKSAAITSDPKQANYLDMESRWVFVSRQSGLPTTAENAYVAPTTAVSDVNNSRHFATSNQNSSGI